MSYILDALNKADKERKTRETPNLHSTSSDVVEPKRVHVLQWGIGITVVLLAGLAWLLQTKEIGQQIKTAAVIIPAQPAFVSPPIVTEKLQSEEETPKEKALSPSEIKLEAQSETQVTKQPEPKHIPHIMHLNESIRSLIPPISISAHVYSKDKNKRMVIINNRVLHEQQYIAEKLMLTAIKENHIELNYDGHVFSMGIKDSWPPY